MAISGHGGATDLEAFEDADSAFARIEAIYRQSTKTLLESLESFRQGARELDVSAACYPYVGITVGPSDFETGASLAYGSVPAPGTYGTTLTRPELFRSYYLNQLSILLRNHRRPVVVGLSDCPIPLSFVIEVSGEMISDEAAEDLRRLFPVPSVARIDDSIANGTYHRAAGESGPLALFEAERVDYSLVRLEHYTGTAPDYFQRFILFTNYQRYVDEFVAFARKEIAEGSDYKAFVEPGNCITHNPRLSDRPSSGECPRALPQMPAYHLMRDRHEGITLVNIGVGPSNAKTITDHIAVLRPHCWIMVGHCGGLRKSQRLGDYVLAHAYARSDHVLDDDLPTWVPVPPIAEVQVALTQAVAEITGLAGPDLKSRLRTGTVFTTDDRDWELKHGDLSHSFHQSRAIAVDMESGTFAANGYRLRVPYGTLLCVSDKPLHGQIKLPGMAHSFYRERVNQHLQIGIRTLDILREQGVERLHSRKLRSFDEPAFR